LLILENKLQGKLYFIYIIRISFSLQVLFEIFFTLVNIYRVTLDMHAKTRVNCPLFSDFNQNWNYLTFYRFSTKFLYEFLVCSYVLSQSLLASITLISLGEDLKLCSPLGNSLYFFLTSLSLYSRIPSMNVPVSERETKCQSPIKVTIG
jgi:hypothetical protein